MKNSRLLSGVLRMNSFEFLPTCSADLDQLLRGRGFFVDQVDGVAAAIEDVVVAVGGLLEADRIAEQSDDVWRKSRDRLEDLNGPG